MMALLTWMWAGWTLRPSSVQERLLALVPCIAFLVSYSVTPAMVLNDTTANRCHCCKVDSKELWAGHARHSCLECSSCKESVVASGQWTSRILKRANLNGYSISWQCDNWVMSCLLSRLVVGCKFKQSGVVVTPQYSRHCNGVRSDGAVEAARGGRPIECQQTKSVSATFRGFCLCSLLDSLTARAQFCGSDMNGCLLVMDRSLTTRMTAR